jgi:hypothetical protein
LGEVYHCWGFSRNLNIQRKIWVSYSIWAFQVLHMINNNKQ